jgi:hypothetical protein
MAQIKWIGRKINAVRGDECVVMGRKRDNVYTVKAGA